MNKYFKVITKSVLALASVMIAVSCESDTWKDHYSVKSDGNESIASLAETIDRIPEAKNFVEALKSTYMYNGNKKTSLTYWDFLNDNQFLTVWLPDNSTITDAEWDEYKSTADDKDHKKVGTEFILNHIARFSHPVGSDTKERIKMLSGKTYGSIGKTQELDGVGYIEKNIRCTNGILHKLNGRIHYRPNLYDYITGASSINSSILDKVYNYNTQRNGELGTWIANFSKEEIDEERSIKGDINEETGEAEYIDKVIRRSNEILKKYGFIDVEDSDYIVVLPVPEKWDSVYNSVKSYFTYDSTDKVLIPVADSLQKYWSNASMITDVFFNRKLQKNILDYVRSTQYSKLDRIRDKNNFHEFSKPYEPGGLFYNIVDSVKCSNGVIYIKDSWPYSDSVFRRTIKIEAEDGDGSESEGMVTRKRYAKYMDSDSSQHSVAVLDLFSRATSWTLTYRIKNNLRGKYRLKAVFYRYEESDNPQNINFDLKYLWGDRDQVLWNGNKQGQSRKQTYTVGKTLLKPDTVLIGVGGRKDNEVYDFGCGNYESGKGKINLTIRCSSKANEEHVYLDCIILEPVFE